MLNNNILVLNNHGLGDVVMSLPFFESLLASEVSSTILVLFKSNLEKELFTLTKLYINNTSKFRLYNVREIKKLFWYIFRIKKGYSLGINEQKSIKLFKMLRVNKYYLAHPYEYNESECKHIINNNKRIHKSYLYSNLLNVTKDINSFISYKDYFVDNIGSKIFSNYIVLSGGSGELEKHKRWTITGYKEIVEMILDNTDHSIVFVGSRSEQMIVDDIILNIDKKYSSRIIQLNGKTNLPELISILRNSNLVIGNDNGVVHIAAACASNILVLFGSTDYAITGPMGDKISVIDNKIECAPCYAKDDNITGCENNICMKSITSEQVYKKIEEIVKYEKNN